MSILKILFSYHQEDIAKHFNELNIKLSDYPDRIRVHLIAKHLGILFLRFINAKSCLNVLLDSVDCS